MKKREGGILAWAAAVFLLVGMAAGCSRSEEARYQLNPKQPVMITVWNYYNGQTKQAFDNLVSRFNETVGMEMGIIVDSVSYGDVNQLAEEAYNSASGRLGADAMPNLFAAYPENAYRIDVLGKLVDLNQSSHFPDYRHPAFPPEGQRGRYHALCRARNPPEDRFPGYED